MYTCWQFQPFLMVKITLKVANLTLPQADLLEVPTVDVSILVGVVFDLLNRICRLKKNLKNRFV